MVTCSLSPSGTAEQSVTVELELERSTIVIQAGLNVTFACARVEVALVAGSVYTAVARQAARHASRAAATNELRMKKN